MIKRLCEKVNNSRYTDSPNDSDEPHQEGNLQKLLRKLKSSLSFSKENKFVFL